MSIIHRISANTHYIGNKKAKRQLMGINYNNNGNACQYTSLHTKMQFKYAQKSLLAVKCNNNSTL